MKGTSNMKHMKSVFAVSLLIASLGMVPQASSQTTQIMIAGSSAIWQTIALGTYNKGACPSGSLKPCHHATYKGFNLIDSRPTSSVTDSNTIWVVWDNTASSSGGPKVWAYLKVDSVVGQRCYFAQPHCNVVAPASFNYGALANAISSTLWGDKSS